MQYAVQVVSDEDMPAGVEWMIAERNGHPPVMFLCGTPARVWKAMRAWEDTCEPPAVPSLLRPLSPVPLPVPRQPTEPSWLAS